MILANHGATRAHIIVGDDASGAAIRAANELSRYVSMMTGANLTIHKASRGTIGNPDAAEICVGVTGRKGEPDASGLKNDGYIIRTVANRLFIIGQNDRAVLHAVYAFLEDYLGCRFFTDTVEHIPYREYLTIGTIDRTVESPFEYREIYGNICYDDDEYAAKRGLNGNNYKLDAEHGGSILYHGFVHTFNHYCPPDKYFAEHPEYFSMVDGKRIIEHTQLCLTNPDVLRIVTDGVMKAIEEHPEATIFSVSQNDCYNPCTCPECAKVDAEEGGHAGTLIRFVNIVAGAVAEKYPHVIIDTLAYQYTRQAPKLTKPAPNVAVRICTIECCFAHPLVECDSVSDTFKTRVIGTPTFQNDLREWAGICNRMHVWDYTTNYRHYLNPMPNLPVLQSNIKFFLENGVTGIFEQGNGEDLSGEFGELRYYIISKLFWEPDGDVEKWKSEFMQAFYGMGARPISEFIDALNRHVKDNNVHVSIYDDPNKGHMPDWLIALADEKFDEAERLADDETVLERVRKSRLQVKYCKLFRMAQDDPGRALACENLIAELKHFGFARIREWRPVEASYDELRVSSYKNVYAF